MSIVISAPLFRGSVSVVVIHTDEQYMYYTDGNAIWRKGFRGYSYVIDKALTPTGFSGTENTDWENVYNII